MNSIVYKAFHFAREKHDGHLDDNGDEYFWFHLVPVADMIEVVAPDDDELIAAAYLHDTLEDTDTTYDDLKFEFGQVIADLVVEVTHLGQADEKGYYFPFLETQRGIMLKFADRLSNISRMQSWNTERQEHYLKRSKFWKSE